MTHPAYSKAHPHPPQARILDWSALQFKLIWAYSGPPDAGGRYGSYDTEHIKAWLIRSGIVEIEEHKHVTRACAGQWLLGNPGHDKRRFSEDAEILSISFHLAWATGETLFQNEPTYVFNAINRPRLEETAQSLCDFIQTHFPGANTSLPSRVSDIHNFIQLQQRFLVWVEEYILVMTGCGAAPKRLGVADERILRALTTLDTWPLTQKLDRSDIAKEAGLTIQHLDRLFLSQLGITPARYIENLRLEKARQSVGSGNAPIKEIAYSLGFLSVSHFSRWFKSHLKASPQLFRQQSKAEQAKRSTQNPPTQ